MSLPANLVPNKLAHKVPNNIPKNLPFFFLVSYFIVLVMPFNKIREFSIA